MMKLLSLFVLAASLLILHPGTVAADGCSYHTVALRPWGCQDEHRHHEDRQPQPNYQTPSPLVTIVIQAPAPPPTAPSVPAVWYGTYQFFWFAPGATGYVVSEHGRNGYSVEYDASYQTFSLPFAGCIQVNAYNGVGFSGWSTQICAG